MVLMLSHNEVSRIRTLKNCIANLQVRNLFSNSFKGNITLLIKDIYLDKSLYTYNSVNYDCFKLSTEGPYHQPRKKQKQKRSARIDVHVYIG